MSDKEKLTQGKNRGVLAKQVLENPVYQEALVIIRGDLMVKFENTKPEDSGKRDEIWRQMRTVAEIEKRIKKVMVDGRVCEAELSRLEKAKKLIGL